MPALKIAVIAGSTRPGAVSAAVAQWVTTSAAGRSGAQYEFVDLAEQNLPLFDEPAPPMMNRYTHPHTLQWAALIESFDGYVFVTPEYNHSTSAVLKNALDFLYAEWNDKAAAFVSYGFAGGVRAVEHLRQITSALRMAHVSSQVSLSMRDDFDADRALHPSPHHDGALDALFAELEQWATALREIRTKSPS